VIVIELRAGGANKIIVDGRDIANYCTSVRVRHTSGRGADGAALLPEVDLTLVGPIHVTVDGKVKVGAEYDEQHSFKREELNRLIPGSASDAALLPRITAAPHQSDSGDDE
jgi:hypothetical protein